MSASLIGHCCQAPCIRCSLSSLRGSRFSTWSALRVVQAATSIGRNGLESLALGRLLMTELGQNLPKMPCVPSGSSCPDSSRTYIQWRLYSQRLRLSKEDSAKKTGNKHGCAQAICAMIINHHVPPPTWCGHKAPTCPHPVSSATLSSLSVQKSHSGAAHSCARQRGGIFFRVFCPKAAALFCVCHNQ